MGFISGIQQIGIGTSDIRSSLLDYKQLFGMNVLVFDDTSEASLMTQYTGGEVHERRAMFTLNMQGGGGFELWQFNTRTGTSPKSVPAYGDLGIFAARLKCPDVEAAHCFFSLDKSLVISAVQTNPVGGLHFWLLDSNGNTFNVASGNHWFSKPTHATGGVNGAVIGVKDMDEAIRLYRDVLGIDTVVYDYSGTCMDTPDGKAGNYRRVMLRKEPAGKGAFYKLLGDTELELVQCLDRKPSTIYANRYWGDCGFIHLCFDVLDMDGLKERALSKGFPFTVDSKNSFEMGKAAGRFCYLEDPDGTLIELVETHKVPILKKWGLYLDLKKRNLEKPLPDWMIRLMALNKVK